MDNIIPEDNNKTCEILKQYLPFLKKVMNIQSLGIPKENLIKLKRLYEMIDSNRFSENKFETCQKIIHFLYAKYNKVITKDEVNNKNDFKDVAHSEEIEDKTRSSEINIISNKNNQNLNCEFEFLNSKLTQQTFDENIHKRHKVISEEMLKSINLSDIDMDNLQKAIESMEKTGNEPVELPCLPPTDLKKLQKVSDKCIPLIKSNCNTTSNNAIPLLPKKQPHSDLIPKVVSTSIQKKLNSEINILQKISSSNEPKQKCISSLKPGTLTDLDTCKKTRCSLHTESMRPIKSLKKKNYDKTISRNPNSFHNSTNRSTFKQCCTHQKHCTNHLNQKSKNSRTSTKYSRNKQNDHSLDRKKTNAVKKNSMMVSCCALTNSFAKFGVVFNKGDFKNYKIPKIKNTEKLANNLKDLNTDINVGEKNVNNDPIKGNNTDANFKIKEIAEKTIETEYKTCKSRKSNTVNDLKIEIKKDNYAKNNLEGDVNKDYTTNKELKSKRDQDGNLEFFSKSDSRNIKESDHKYSHSKDFQEIIKKSVEIYDEPSLKIRTRSYLKKNGLSLTKPTIKNEPKKVQLEVRESSKILDIKSRECSKNLDSVSLQTFGPDIIESIEPKQNVISSTSKVPSEVDYTTEYQISKENIVLSNEIHASFDKTRPKITETVISNIIANPELISILQDQEKITKLNKLLERSDMSINEQNNLNKEHEYTYTDKLKKEGKKKRRKMRKDLDRMTSLSQEKNRNDDHLNTEKNMVDGSFGDLNDNGSKNLKTYDCLAVDQVKKKEIHEKSKEKYAHSKTQDKYSCKDLSNFDNNIKKSEDLISKVSSNDLQTYHKPTNYGKNVFLKRKKPFVGPLSVKLARQRMEAKLINSQNVLVENTQSEVETTNIICETINKSKSLKNDKKKILDSQSIANMLQPIVVLHRYDDPTYIKASNDTTFQNELPIVEQNSIIKTPIESNIADVKSKKRRQRMTEIDKLHANNNAFCVNVCSTSNLGLRKKNKPVNYANTNVFSTKTPNSNLNDDKNCLNTQKKKKVKKSTLEFNKNNSNTKKYEEFVDKFPIDNLSELKQEIQNTNNRNTTEDQVSHTSVSELLVISKKKLQVDSTFTENKLQGLQESIIKSPNEKDQSHQVSTQNPTTAEEPKPLMTLKVHQFLGDKLSLPHQVPTQNPTTVEEPKPLMTLKVRQFPGDKLSLRDESMTEKEERNLNENVRILVLKDNCIGGTVGSIQCEPFNKKLLFKCRDMLCPIEFSTRFYNGFLKHIELYHKFTTWDGMCNICGHGMWRNFNNLYMKNALEHLISYHLIECQITKINTPNKTKDNVIIIDDDDDDL